MPNRASPTPGSPRSNPNPKTCLRFRTYPYLSAFIRIDIYHVTLFSTESTELTTGLPLCLVGCDMSCVELVAKSEAQLS